MTSLIHTYMRHDVTRTLYTEIRLKDNSEDKEIINDNKDEAIVTHNKMEYRGIFQ